MSDQRTQPGLPTPPFVSTWQGVAVECARFGEDLGPGVLTAVGGDARTRPAVRAVDVLQVKLALDRLDPYRG